MGQRYAPARGAGAGGYWLDQGPPTQNQITVASPVAGEAYYNSASANAQERQGSAGQASPRANSTMLYGRAGSQEQGAANETAEKLKDPLSGHHDMAGEYGDSSYHFGPDRANASQAREI